LIYEKAFSIIYEYYNLISNADCLLALTYEDDCLQSGAYEAFGIEVSRVISESKALRDYFGESAIYQVTILLILQVTFKKQLKTA